MPQQNMTSKLGSSPSIVLNRVLQHGANQQQPVAVPSVTKAGQHNKQPVAVAGK